MESLQVVANGAILKLYAPEAILIQYLDVTHFVQQTAKLTHIYITIVFSGFFRFIIPQQLNQLVSNDTFGIFSRIKNQ